MWARENEFDLAVMREATRTGVPPSLIKAVIGVESGFNPQAVNPSGPGSAWGLMQMIPATARALGYQGEMAALLVDTDLAIRLGAMLLQQNLQQARNVVADSVSAYNGGFRPSLGFGARLPSGQYRNQDYVDRVLEAKAYFEGRGTPGDMPGTFCGDCPVRRGSVGAQPMASPAVTPERVGYERMGSGYDPEAVGHERLGRDNPSRPALTRADDEHDQELRRII